MEKEISKMKQDSIVLINQITTISKQRIFKDTIRRNVKLSTAYTIICSRGFKKDHNTPKNEFLYLLLTSFFTLVFSNSL